MDRRSTLKLGAALAASPWWWACAPDAAQRESATPHGSPLKRALEAAKRNGKPVLVFVAPEPPQCTSELSDAVTEVFQNGDRELYLDLALCEIAFASPSQVAAEVSARVDPNEVGLVEDVGGSPRWTGVEFCVPSNSDDDPCVDPASRAKRNAVALRDVLAGSPGTLRARERAAKAALGPERCAGLLARLDAGATPSDAELDAGAAIVRAHAAWPRVQSEVIRSVGARIFTRPPEGSRWAGLGACSTPGVVFTSSDHGPSRALLEARYSHALSIPGDERAIAKRIESLTALCGMAYAAEASRDFLMLYVDAP